jgi:hypothetical protein
MVSLLRTLIKIIKCIGSIIRAYFFLKKMKKKLLFFKTCDIIYIISFKEAYMNIIFDYHTRIKYNTWTNKYESIYCITRNGRVISTTSSIVKARALRIKLQLKHGVN